MAYRRLPLAVVLRAQACSWGTQATESCALRTLISAEQLSLRRRSTLPPADPAAAAGPPRATPPSPAAVVVVTQQAGHGAHERLVLTLAGAAAARLFILCCRRQDSRATPGRLRLHIPAPCSWLQAGRPLQSTTSRQLHRMQSHLGLWPPCGLPCSASWLLPFCRPGTQQAWPPATCAMCGGRRCTTLRGQ